MVMNPETGEEAEGITKAHGRALLVLSKKFDVYDMNGGWQAYLKDHPIGWRFETQDFLFYDLIPGELLEENRARFRPGRQLEE